MTTGIEFTYQGKMVSGKNQQQIVMLRGRVMKFPNKNFKSWRANFQQQAFAQLAVSGSIQRVRDVKTGQQAVFGGPVHLQLDYWPGDLIRRDCSGILDALFHAIEAKNGGLLVFDDSQVKQVDWLEHPVDRERPRLRVRVGAVV